MPSFSERLVELRKEKGLTQQQLATALEIHTRGLQNYESGRVPEPSILVKIADYFDVSLDYLMGRSDISTAPTRDTDESDVDPAEAAFYTWVQEHVTGMHFYDFKKSMENEEWLKGLRIVYEREKGRKPGQKQGE